MSLLASTTQIISEAAEEGQRVMHDIEADVRAFHQKFGHPAPEVPTKLDQEQLDFRCDLIDEEADELKEALRSGDPVKIVREALDLIYVATGACVSTGIPLMACWKALQDANMEKERPPAGSPRGTKPIKPAGWCSPDARIRTILACVMDAEDLRRRRRSAEC